MKLTQNQFDVLVHYIGARAALQANPNDPYLRREVRYAHEALVGQLLDKGDQDEQEAQPQAPSAPDDRL